MVSLLRKLEASTGSTISLSESDQFFSSLLFSAADPGLEADHAQLLLEMVSQYVDPHGMGKVSFYCPFGLELLAWAGKRNLRLCFIISWRAAWHGKWSASTRWHGNGWRLKEFTVDPQWKSWGSQFWRSNIWEMSMHRQSLWSCMPVKSDGTALSQAALWGLEAERKPVRLYWSSQHVSLCEILWHWIVSHFFWGHQTSTKKSVRCMSAGSRLCWLRIMSATSHFWVTDGSFAKIPASEDTAKGYWWEKDQQGETDGWGCLIWWVRWLESSNQMLCIFSVAHWIQASRSVRGWICGCNKGQCRRCTNNFSLAKPFFHRNNSRWASITCLFVNISSWQNERQAHLKDCICLNFCYKPSTLNGTG